MLATPVVRSAPREMGPGDDDIDRADVDLEGEDESGEAGIEAPPNGARKLKASHAARDRNLEQRGRGRGKREIEDRG